MSVDGSHSSTLCVFVYVKQKQPRSWGWYEVVLVLDEEEVKERLVGDPSIAKKNREKCEVVYLGFPPLSA